MIDTMCLGFHVSELLVAENGHLSIIIDRFEEVSGNSYSL